MFPSTLTKATLLLAILSAMLIPHQLLATVPDLIPVQGMLSDTEGTAIDGPTDLKFAIFDAAADGTELWWSERLDYNVTQGFFAIYLGAQSALELDALVVPEELWLEITADGDVMDRIRLGSVPFALEAERCEQVGTMPASEIQPVLKGNCSPGEYVESINPTTGEFTCSTPPDKDTTYDGRNFALSNKTCGAGEFMAGINANGTPICRSLRSWINDNCYIYFAWRDDCDGCNTSPSKYGRTRGNTASGCATTGGDGDCQNFTLHGQNVRMYGLNTDGDVNGDDKFWVGLKCH